MAFTKTLANLDPSIPRYETYGPNSLDDLGHKDYLDQVEQLIIAWQRLPWNNVPNIDTDSPYSNVIEDFSRALRKIQQSTGADRKASEQAVAELKKAHSRLIQALSGIAADLRLRSDTLHHDRSQKLVGEIEGARDRARELTDSISQRVLETGVSDHAIAYKEAAQKHFNNHRRWLCSGSALMGVALLWVLIGLWVVGTAFTPALIGVTAPMSIIVGTGTWALRRSSDERRHQVRNEDDARLLQTFPAFYADATSDEDKSNIVSAIARAVAERDRL